MPGRQTYETARSFEDECIFLTCETRSEERSLKVNTAAGALAGIANTCGQVTELWITGPETITWEKKRPICHPQGVLVLDPSQSESTPIYLVFRCKITPWHQPFPPATVDPAHIQNELTHRKSCQQCAFNFCCESFSASLSCFNVTLSLDSTWSDTFGMKWNARLLDTRL